MKGLNKVQLIGNLGKNPESRTTTGGKKVVTFSLATNEYKSKDEDHTEWHNIIVWEALAEVAEKWLKKGDVVYLEGKIRSRKYEDKDKVVRYITEIVCNNLVMLSGKKEPQPQPEDFEPTENLHKDEDDLPF
ncbi:MAG: single-stranded DNA-binding protein [Lutibacter sp.]